MLRVKIIHDSVTDTVDLLHLLGLSEYSGEVMCSDTDNAVCIHAPVNQYSDTTAQEVLSGGDEIKTRYSVSLEADQWRGLTEAGMHE